MNIESVNFDAAEVRKLLGAASADGALLYIYLKAGNLPSDAAQVLHLSEARFHCAMATLRQLGLWQEETQHRILAGERPVYSERDVLEADSSDFEFKALRGEVERLLGRNLNTEELKILLGFIRYLGLPADVISVLICYCKDRARQRGSLRNPSLRTIEKEAYHWAEQGIDTMEEAAAFIQRQNLRQSQLEQLKRAMQIYDRPLTPSEEKYARSWLEMGFDTDAIAVAHDRTCVCSGGRNWAYTNRILTRWHEANIHTAQQVEERDKKPSVPKGASGKLGEAELENIRRLMQEDT